MPILGVIASSQQVAPSGDWDFIASVSPTSSGQEVIEITSIPQTYKHLYVTWTIMGVTNGDIQIIPSGYTANANQFFTQGSVGAFYNSNIYVGYVNYAVNVNSGYPHWGYGLINDYTGTNNNKSMLTWNTAISATTSETDNVMNKFSSDAAITAVRARVTGGGMATSSKLNLYGIKN